MFHTVLIQLFFDMFLVNFSHEDEKYLRKQLGRFFYLYMVFYILFLFVFRSDSKVKREYNRRVQIFLKQKSEEGLKYDKKRKGWLKNGIPVDSSDFLVAFNGFDGHIHVNAGRHFDKNQAKKDIKKKKRLQFEEKKKNKNKSSSLLEEKNIEKNLKNNKKKVFIDPSVFVTVDKLCLEISFFHPEFKVDEIMRFRKIVLSQKVTFDRAYQIFLLKVDRSRQAYLSHEHKKFLSGNSDLKKLKKDGLKNENAHKNH